MKKKNNKNKQQSTAPARHLKVIMDQTTIFLLGYKCSAFVYDNKYKVN